MHLFAHKTGTLHAMLQAISRGHHWWLAGEVSAARVSPMVAKFAQQWGTETPKRTRARNKSNGLASAVLFVHPTYVRPSFSWWLMLTEGEHPARGAEAGFRDGRDRRQRLTFQDEYEALQLPSPGALPRWTWRLTASFEEDLRAQIRESVRHRRDPQALKNVIRVYHSLPGFRGVRHQVAALRRHTAGEWRRAKAEGECPHLPVRVPPYARYKTYRTVPLEIVRDRLLAGLSPYSVEMRYGECTMDAPEGATKVRDIEGWRHELARDGDRGTP